MKILIIIAKEGFRDEEYQDSYNYFKSQDIGIDVASTIKGECFGKYGTVVESDIYLEEVDIHKYFAVVIIGGPGSRELVGNKDLENILKKAKKLNIVISAICFAPIILAKAGLLANKKATVYNEDNKQSPIFKKHNVKYKNKPVVVDGLIVTGRDYKAATIFAKKVVEAAECEKCFIK